MVFINPKILFYNGMKKKSINLIQFLYQLHTFQIMWRLEKSTHNMCKTCSIYNNMY